MILNANPKNIKIAAKLSGIDVEIIKIYIQGVIHGFCQNNYDTWFSVRKLFGADNSDWSDTPLQKIYDYYRLKQNENAKENAAKDVGYLLKQVLMEDCKYTFDMKKGYRTNEYHVNTNED